jgi:multidrug transporter EmrE-like cation transporter
LARDRTFADGPICSWFHFKAEIMKALVLYALAAALYVTGGVFMKYSAGLTRWLPGLALVALFSAGALMQAWAMKREPLGSSYVVVLGLEALLAVLAGYFLFAEQMTIRMASGVVLVVLGMILLRLT